MDGRERLKKLKHQTGYRKHYGRGADLDQKGVKPEIVKMMEEAGVDFSMPEKAMEKRNMFQIWLKRFKTDDLTEIERLDTVIQILEADMTQRTMEKITQGKPLNREDIALIRVLKESLESLHKMKYGEKHMKVTADIKDIRKMMFE